MSVGPKLKVKGTVASVRGTAWLKQKANRAEQERGTCQGEVWLLVTSSISLILLLPFRGKKLKQSCGGHSKKKHGTHHNFRRSGRTFLSREASLPSFSRHYACCQVKPASAENEPWRPAFPDRHWKLHDDHTHHSSSHVTCGSDRKDAYLHSSFEERAMEAQMLTEGKATV